MMKYKLGWIVSTQLLKVKRGDFPKKIKPCMFAGKQGHERVDHSTRGTHVKVLRWNQHMGAHQKGMVA